MRSGPVVSFPGQTNVYVCTRRHARKVEHRRQATPLLPATGDTACDRARTCSGGFQTMHPCNPHQPIPYSQNNRMQCCRCTAPELSNGRRFDSSPFCTTPPASTTQKVHRAEQERERETDHHPPAAFMPGRVTSPSMCPHLVHAHSNQDQGVERTAAEDQRGIMGHQYTQRNGPR